MVHRAFAVPTSLPLSGLESRLSRLRCLSGNQLKLIAVASMLVDHLCKVVLLWLAYNVWVQWSAASCKPLETFVFSQLEPFGRVAFPLFCFLLSEGFCHTTHRKRYFFLMGLFALISEIPFDLAFFSDTARELGTFPFYWSYQNVFFTLFLGLIAMALLEQVEGSYRRHRSLLAASLLGTLAVVLPALAAWAMHTDYGAKGVCYIAAFYLLRRHRLLQVLSTPLLYMAFTGSLPALWMLVSYFLILLYNGQRGKWRGKYFFYVFYPAHLALFYLLIAQIFPALYGMV